MIPLHPNGRRGIFCEKKPRSRFSPASGLIGAVYFVRPADPAEPYGFGSSMALLSAKPFRIFKPFPEDMAMTFPEDMAMTFPLGYGYSISSGMWLFHILYDVAMPYCLLTLWLQLERHGVVYKAVQKL